MTRERKPASPANLAKDDDARIRHTHAWLKRKKKAIEADLSVHAAEIGEFLIETFFDGDVELACSHNPHKEHSLRRLCNRDDAPFSLSSLRTFIQVAQNFRLMPRDQAARLPPSHHALLYRVANPRERVELAGECARNGTSARRLRELVKGRGRRRPGAGRKPSAPSVKELRAIRERLELVGKSLPRSRVNDADVEGLITEARELRDRLAELLDQLEDRRAK